MEIGRPDGAGRKADDLNPPPRIPGGFDEAVPPPGSVDTAEQAAAAKVSEEVESAGRLR